jgi:serine/threonine-protein kinase ATR
VLPLKRFRRPDISTKARALVENMIVHHPHRDVAIHRIRHSQELIDNMLTLCYDPPPASLNAKTRTYQLKRKNQKLIAALSTLLELNMIPIMPLISSFTVTLPASGLPDPLCTGFADDIPRILAFDENVEVLKSKEKPKKVTFIGSDGIRRPFLCKREERGDMRKNSRLMEFASVINRLFLQDPESRRRSKLKLQTYGVFPMTEDSGVIEWVPNTTAFRHILNELYRQISVDFDFVRIRHMYDECLEADGRNRNHDKELRMLGRLIEMFPAVFHRWFLHTFPDPSAWLEARTTFVTSTASWSMVGSLVGLGDRHGENLLLDASSGALVQVDFDCLFDKGAELACPERVPFRLTHNMVDAFGVTGFVIAPLSRTFHFDLVVFLSSQPV